MMATCSAYIKIFPLVQRPIEGIIEDACCDFRSPEIEVLVDSMSITIIGEADEVVNAVQSGLRASNDRGEAVLVATVSDSCPARHVRR